MTRLVEGGEARVTANPVPDPSRHLAPATGVHTHSLAVRPVTGAMLGAGASLPASTGPASAVPASADGDVTGLFELPQPNTAATAANPRYHADLMAIWRGTVAHYRPRGATMDICDAPAQVREVVAPRKSPRSTSRRAAAKPEVIVRRVPG